MKNYIFVDQKEKIKDIMPVLNGNKIRCIFVLSKKKLIGVISQGDLIRFFIRNKIVANQNVSQIMNMNFIYIKEPYDKIQIKKIFRKSKIQSIPVLNSNDEIIKIYTLYDVL